MKKLLMLIITILTLSLFGFSEIKVGVINGEEIILKTKKGKLIKERLDQLRNSKRQKIDTMQNEIKKLQKALTSPALNGETQRKKNRELEDKKTNYDRFLQDAQNEFQQQSQKEMVTLYKEIMPLIHQVGKSKGFTLILDLTNAGIAYFDETIDITEEVIIAVDAKFPGK